MPSSLYGSARYGSSRYANIISERPFRYACGLQVTKERPFRYACLGSIAKDRLFRYFCTGGVTKDRYFRYLASGWLNPGRYFRYTVKQGITKDRYFRYLCTQGVINNRLFRYSTLATQSERKFRYAAVQPIVSEKYFKYSALTDTFITIIGGNPSGNPNSGGAGTPGYPYVNPLQGSLYATNTEIPYTNNLGIASFGVIFKESQPAQWSLSLVDSMGLFNPRNDESSWYQKMDDEPYQGDSLVKWIRSNLTYGGVPFEFKGVPLHYSWSQDSRDKKFYFTWSGIDTADPLFRESETFETKRSKLNDKKKAHDIIKTILNQYGFTARLDFPDFIVPTMHMQNSRPIEFIKALLEVYQAEWQIEGDNVFHAYIPQQKIGNHNWEFNLSSNVKIIEQVDVNSDFSDIINYLIVARAKEVGQAAPASGGEGNDMVCKEFGEYNFSFDVPMNAIYMRPLEQNAGFFSTFVCYNPEGTIVGVIDDVGAAYPPALRQSTAYNVKSIKFTWGAQPNLPPETQAVGGFGRIRFFGAPVDSFAGVSTETATTLGFDETFVVKAKYQASIDKHGKRKLELTPNPLIPTKDVAKIHAAEYLRRIFRTRNNTTYRVPLNFMIRVGDTIKEIYDEINLERNLYVVEVAHNFSNNPNERYTRVQAQEYANPFNVTYE